MAESVNRLSWSQLLWGLFFSPRHTAWEFSQEHIGLNREVLILTITAFIGGVCGLAEVFYISSNFPKLDPEGEQNSVFFVLIGAVFVFIGYPIYKWVTRLVLRIEKTHEVNKIAAFALSGLCVNIHLAILFLIYILMIVNIAITNNSDALAYGHYVDIGMVIYFSCSIVFASFYISGIFGKGLMSSFVISTVVVLVSFLIMLIMFLVVMFVGLTLVEGGLGWLEN